MVHADGRTVIAYRGTCCGCGDHTERVGLLHAPAWNGTYIRVGTPIFDDAEDLFMWLSARGTHMVFHSQKIDHGTRRGVGSDHKKKRGGYAFSADGVFDWVESDWELFPSEIRWDDGRTTFLLKQQRPSLLFDPLTNRPTHLVTGVDEQFDPCCQWYIYGSAWTLISHWCGVPGRSPHTPTWPRPAPACSATRPPLDAAAVSPPPQSMARVSVPRAPMDTQEISAKSGPLSA